MPSSRPISTCRHLLLGLLLLTGVVHADDEGVFFGDTVPRLEQPVQVDRSVMWTLPNEATLYRPANPAPPVQAALQAQREGRYLDALAQVDQLARQHADRSLDLLRASLYLQGGQGNEAETLLKPLRNDSTDSADAYALSAMARLQQGDLVAALADAQRAQRLGRGTLPSLALSYALQGKGRLAEARAVVHQLNAMQPGVAVNLAREAELSLTQNDVAAATHLIAQARAIDAGHPYVVAVSGLVWLINGDTPAASAAFETALKRDPQDAKALLGLGLAKVKLGDAQAGLRALQAAAQADPGNAVVLTYLGRVQQQLGQTEAARASWQQAQRADPNDPTPWLYLAQAQMQANAPVAAAASLREAQARSASRAVYRGDLLLQQDALLLQSNLAETQRLLGHSELALQTLADTHSAQTLKDQAAILQGVRFAESARRSLALQSLFYDTPGALPVALDVYGDGAGETGGATPQHGAVSGLTAAMPSYNDYGALFNSRNALQVDAVVGSRNTHGEQLRAGVGGDTFGFSLAQNRFASDGFMPFNALDNTSWQGVLQWRPAPDTQAFLLYENYHSDRGETYLPADVNFGFNADIFDRSAIARLGLRHALGNGDEVQVLLSRQRTRQLADYTYLVDQSTNSQATSSTANGVDLQYRTQAWGQALQWGLAVYRSQMVFPGLYNTDKLARQLYVASQRQLAPKWKLDWGLGWARVSARTQGYDPVAKQAWLPRLGVVYAPDAATHIRLALWQNLGMSSVGNASLMPASLAGMVQTRPGDTGNRVRAAALAFDRRINPDWLTDASIQTRSIGTPIPDYSTTPAGTSLSIQHADSARVGVHWQPIARPWTVGLSGEFEKTRNDDLFFANDSLDTQRLRAAQLDARWFIDASLSAHVQWSRNWISGQYQVPSGAYFDPPTPTRVPYGNVFNMTDLTLEWRLPAGRGHAGVGVRNLENAHFTYIDPDPLSPRFSNGRLVYGTLTLTW